MWCRKGVNHAVQRRMQMQPETDKEGRKVVVLQQVGGTYESPKDSEGNHDSLQKHGGSLQEEGGGTDEKGICKRPKMKAGENATALIALTREKKKGGKCKWAGIKSGKRAIVGQQRQGPDDIRKK
jgi:single-stranded DNA-binding protein